MVAAASLLALFLLYTGETEPVPIYPALSTPVSGAKVAMPRLVGGPLKRARDFAWRQALVLVEVEAITRRELGEVVDQLPLPEMLIRAGDTLTVTVSLGPAGGVLPQDPRVGSRVPLRLTPIGLATVAVRETQAAGRTGARTAPATSTAFRAAGAPTDTPVGQATIAARGTRVAARASAATATFTPTLITTSTLRAAAGTPTLPPSPAAPSTRERPEPTRAPAPTQPPEPTSAPEPPTPPPPPPEPPTPPPPPPGKANPEGRAAQTGQAR